MVNSIYISFKDPDGVWDALKSAGLDPNNLEETPEASEAIKTFIEYMEYVTIEINLNTAEARVVPLNEEA